MMSQTLYDLVEGLLRHSELLQERLVMSEALLKELANSEKEEKYFSFASERYPSRPRKKVKYWESDDVILGHDDDSDQDLTYCCNFKKDCHGECSILGILEDSKTERSVSSSKLDKVFQSAPKGLVVAQSSVSDDLPGVWTKKVLPKGLVFGPLKSKAISDAIRSLKTGCPLQEEESTWKSFDEKSWLSYLSFATSELTQNLDAFEKDGLIFFKTNKEISENSELLAGFPDEDDQKKSDDTHPWEEVQSTSPTKSVKKSQKSDSGPKQKYSCKECSYLSKAKKDLIQHAKSHEAIDVHKCFECSKTFATKHAFCIHAGRKHHDSVKKDKS